MQEYMILKIKECKTLTRSPTSFVNIKLTWSKQKWTNEYSFSN